MFRDDSNEIAAALANWLRKPFLSWCFAVNVSVGIAALIAAIVTQIWWLMFIPLLAIVECSAVYFGSIFADVLREKDSEIERLRRELSTH